MRYKRWWCRRSGERPAREFAQPVEGTVWSSVHGCCQASLFDVPWRWSPSSIIHAMALSACLHTRWVIQLTCTPVPMTFAHLCAVICASVNVSIGQIDSMGSEGARSCMTSPAAAITGRVRLARCPTSPTTTSVTCTGVNVNTTLASPSWKTETLPHFP